MKTISSEEYGQMDVRCDHEPVVSDKCYNLARKQATKTRNRSWQVLANRNGQKIIDNGVANRLVIKNVSGQEPEVLHQIGYKNGKLVIAEHDGVNLIWVDK